MTKEATCKEAGEKTFKCTACEHTAVEVLPASTEHAYKGEFDANAHWEVCGVCGAKTEAKEHELKKETDAETHKDACACGFATEAVKHAWDEGKVTKKATTTEVGEMTYTCACGATKTEEIPKLKTPATGDNNVNVALVVLAVMATCGLALTVIGKKRFAR